MTETFEKATSAWRLTCIANIITFILSVGAAYAIDEPSVKWPMASQTAAISAPFHGSDIVIRVSSRTAGAIDSITWAGKQFVNSNDHGREFQSASHFENKGECFNPTEAGSAHDGVGPQSTSHLVALSFGAAQLTTTNQMSYWLGPGEQSLECKGTVSTTSSVLSNDLLIKTVTIGNYGVSNAIQYKVNFRLPEGRHDGLFEALTGYMPSDFDTFWTLDPASDLLSPQSDGPGTQTLPLVFSTPDKNYALGVYSLPSVDSRPVYGRWKFLNRTMASPTVKWNSLFQNKVITPGDHQFNVFMLIGSLDDVRAGMRTLCRRLEPSTCKP